jgi:hypothetical protein
MDAHLPHGSRRGTRDSMHRHLSRIPNKILRATTMSLRSRRFGWIVNLNRQLAALSNQGRREGGTEGGLAPLTSC